MLEIKEKNRLIKVHMDLTEIPRQQHALLIQTVGPFCGDQQLVTSRLEAFSPVKNNHIKHHRVVPHLQNMTLTEIIRLNQFYHSLYTRTQSNVRITELYL